MGKTNTVLILVIVAAVNLSNGFSLTKSPTVETTFSGSSSSSSAFAHSSSGSYSFNGPIDPNDLEKLKASAASAGAAAGAGALASAGAFAHAGAGALAGLSSGSLAGSGSITGESGHLDRVGLGSGEASGGISGFDAGCSGGSSGCGGSQDNQLGSAANVDTGAYKIINTNQYNTGYNSGSQGTNYAVAGQYVESSKAPVGGCTSCKGPFPGPNGSIFDYKLASSVPPIGNAHAAADAGSAAHNQPIKPVSNLPVAPGDIHTSKPATNFLPSGQSNNYHGATSHGIQSGHVSPSLIASFPGSSGSIYDSKPAGAGAVAGAGYVAGAGAGTGAGVGNRVEVVVGSGAGSYYGDSGSEGCKKTPGSPNCGGSVQGSISGVVPVLPGPSGSIYDSKPAHGIGAGASAGAASHGSSGSVSNIPLIHPVVEPTDSVPSGQIAIGVIPILPGPSGSIYDSKPTSSVSSQAAASGAVAGAGSGSYSGSGSVINIPSSHSVAGPACSYNPGSPNYCGGSTTSSQQKPTPGSSASIVPILPGPSGSIYSSKPATSVPSQAGAGSGAYSGSGAVVTTGSGGTFGSVSNIPSTHPIEGPACSYFPGSPNKCASGNVPQYGDISGANAVADANAAAHAGAAVTTGSGGTFGSVSNIPSTHPIVGPVCSYSPGSPNKCASGNVPQYGDISGANVVADANVAAHAVKPFFCLTCKGPFPGPSGSIHDYKLASSFISGGTHGFHSGSGAHVAIYSPPFGSQVTPPSIHPEVPASQGTYYINKPAAPSSDIQVPLIHSIPQFSGQIACSGGDCGSKISNQAAAEASSVTAVYSRNPNVPEVDKYNSNVYSSLHDTAHQSGGIVFDNGDGVYHDVPVTGKPMIKNAERGGYAVNTDEAENTGFIIGPGTGHLPVETDAKPFGTQGAFGGSAAFVKDASRSKPFGTQGAFGGSAAIADVSSAAQSSGFEKGPGTGHLPIETDAKPAGFVKGEHLIATPCTRSDCSSYGAGKANGFVTADVSVQKVEGTLVDDGSYKPECSNGGCDSGANSRVENAYSNNQKFFNTNTGSPVKYECTGASCGDTEVYIIEEKPSNSGSYRTGCSSGSCGISGGDSDSGFTTGQVLGQKGSGTPYDLTNNGGSYSGSNTGAYSGNHGSSGCSTGRCGGSGFGAGGSYGSSGNLLNNLFGSSGLSGTINQFSNRGLEGNVAFSHAGSYSSASSGSFASAGASAHAESFAHSF